MQHNTVQYTGIRACTTTGIKLHTCIYIALFTHHISGIKYLTDDIDVMTENLRKLTENALKNVNAHSVSCHVIILLCLSFEIEFL